MAMRAVAALLVAMALGGCGHQVRYVAGSTGSGDQIKFLYVEKGGEQGVIKCKRAEDGTLSACQPVELVLKGE